jgi:hypothetical protein
MDVNLSFHTKERKKLTVFVNKMLRRINEPKRDEEEV